MAASLALDGVSGEGNCDVGHSGPPQSRLGLELSVFRLQVLGCVGILIVWVCGFRSTGSDVRSESLALVPWPSDLRLLAVPLSPAFSLERHPSFPVN